LDQALGQRTLDDARNPARTLTWRIHRLGQRHTPSPRAQAAMARSTARHPDAAIEPPTVTPAAALQRPHVRRR
ncbi:mobilization protein, partial [Streptomyces sp. NE06-03C]|nr:mobilization protein [Streptomyces sp. NE06-03C]